MLHQYLLHLTSRQPMPSSIDHIILPSHDMEVTIIINKTRVSSVVVSLQCGEVLLYVWLVVVEDCEHERGWKWLFDVNGACLIGFALYSCCCVDDFDVVAGQWLACRSWFLWEGLEA